MVTLVQFARGRWSRGGSPSRGSTRLLSHIATKRAYSLVLAHGLDLPSVHQVATAAGNVVWQTTGPATKIYTVKGQVEPEISLQAGVWTRFCIIWAGWREGNLDWIIAHGACQMQ